MEWDHAERSDPGRRRSGNEDAYLAAARAGLFAVADGMGGHAAGEVASRMATATLEDEATNGDEASIADTLAAATRSANRAIRERAAREPDKRGMGTTLTALALLPAEERCVITHVGDSRCYLLRGGDARTAPSLEQLTTDHTQAQERIEQGRLSPARARGHRLSSVLTRALGADAEVEVDVVRRGIEPGDLLLLCSDGLNAMVDDDDIEQILAQNLALDALADQLIDAANLRGGKDNITVVLIRVEA